MPSLQLAVALALALLIAPAFNQGASAQTQPVILTRSKPPKPPSAPPPDGSRQGGGGLSQSSPSCKNTQKQFTALTPLNASHRLTTGSGPTFWFYVPYAPEAVRSGRFSLLTQDEKSYIYKTDFTLPKTPGIVSIPIPSSNSTLFKEGKVYHWYLELYCQHQANSQPDLQVHGWIQRVAPTADSKSLIDAAMPDIWYDALTRLANLYIASPQDAKLQADWARLLKSAQLEEVAREKLVGAVLPVKE